MAGRPARTFTLPLVVLASLQGRGGDGSDDARAAPGAPPAGARGTAQGGAVGPDTTATAASVDGEIVALLATDESDLYRIAPDGTNLALVHALAGGRKLVGTPDVLGITLRGGSDDDAINAIDLATGRFLRDVPIGEYRSEADDVSGTSCLPGACVIANGAALIPARARQSSADAIASAPSP